MIPKGGLHQADRPFHAQNLRKENGLENTIPHLTYQQFRTVCKGTGYLRIRDGAGGGGISWDWLENGAIWVGLGVVWVEFGLGGVLNILSGGASAGADVFFLRLERVRDAGRGGWGLYRWDRKKPSEGRWGGELRTFSAGRKDGQAAAGDALEAAARS